MPIVTTPGAANANSYADRTEANAYHTDRQPPSPGWAVATDPQKDAALITTGRLLDAWRRAWAGSAVDGVQAMGFPRTGLMSKNGYAIPTTGAASIPQALKNAQAEFAGQVIDEDRMEDDSVTSQRIKKLKVSSIELEFQARTDERLALLRRDSLEAMIPDAVIALLPESWLLDVREEDMLDTFIVENLENDDI